jgi:hypothetical protein
MKMKLKEYRGTTLVILVILLITASMAITGTLSYPAIMIERQAQLISRCVFSDSEFVSPDYGFIFLAPSDYCLLPHRLFPRDGTIQVVPKGWYFVINEYAAGTIVSEARASILFDRKNELRNKSAFMAALQAGGFLEGATIEERVNSSGIQMTIVHNAKGIEAGRRFEWAFIDHPTRPFSISVLSSRIDDPIVFEAVLDGLKAI